MSSNQTFGLDHEVNISLSYLSELRLMRENSDCLLCRDLGDSVESQDRSLDWRPTKRLETPPPAVPESPVLCLQEELTTVNFIFKGKVLFLKKTHHIFRVCNMKCRRGILFLSFFFLVKKN